MPRGKALPLPDCATLRNLYATKTMLELRQMYQTGWPRIKNALVDCGIEIRSAGDNHAGAPYRDPEWLLPKIESGMSAGEIAKLAGVTHGTISAWAKHLRAIEDDKALPARFVVHSCGDGGRYYYSGAEVTLAQARRGREGMRLLSDGVCYEVHGGRVVRAEEFRKVT